MRISLTDAKGQLAELVRRAEAGEPVELTRHGQVVAEIRSAKNRLTREERLRGIAKVRSMAAAKPSPGVSAARSQDFLYGDDGLPK